MTSSTAEPSHVAIYPGWTVTATRPALIIPESAEIAFGDIDPEWEQSISSPDPLELSTLYL